MSGTTALSRTHAWLVIDKMYAHCIHYRRMVKTTLNIKADTEIKKQAQKVAQDLGMPLSTVVNAYLKQFIRTKEVYFSVGGELKPEVKKRLDRLQKEVLVGKNISPAFDSAKEAIRYLNS